MYSAALCRGLIEAIRAISADPPGIFCRCIPRLYAAASLKRSNPRPYSSSSQASIPRLYAAASLKPMPAALVSLNALEVFRGFMPRPH